MEEPQDMADTPHIIRTRDFKSNKKIWVIFDRTNTLFGKPTDTKMQVQARWALTYGKPGGWVRYQGIARPSEFAVTVADYQHPVKEN